MSINEQYSYMFKSDQVQEIMGPSAGSTWTKDPKRLLFMLSRYKFVGKMFVGFENVLEIGCGDAWASRIVRQHVKKLTAVDYDNRFTSAAAKLSTDHWPIELLTHDPLNPKTSFHSKFDGIYLLDVFEHIAQSNEQKMLDAIKGMLTPSGAVIIGMPSLESQSLILPEKRDPGHINCKSGMDLLQLMRDNFDNAFLFSMNDEVVHTGYHSMAHYLIVLCCGMR